MRVLQGVEMDTNLGHLLVYGINERVLERFDLTKRMHDGRRIIAELENLGAVAVPSHPFRESVFGSVIERNFTEVAGIRILERYNGQNNDKQNERADTLCASMPCVAWVVAMRTTCTRLVFNVCYSFR